ncbi:hypothetical protein [Methylococcus geothermalis]|uniref:Uncharacterized protein n=1 Tax=Methylococcus geothermalis TaxID=2681310 RepID=A0A858Q8S6_9GAMM|nr:hypothetical protein [Methylococcus geothermalis]QJD30201.1 hypothetical protein GNH96_09625 [Methylococcus geothermalis]
MPAFSLAGPDEANDRGVWIPKMVIFPFGATLDRRFGASDAERAAMFPNLARFPAADIGFMVS